MIGFIQQAIDLFNGRPAPHVVQTSLFYRDHDFGLDVLPFDLLVDESHSIEFDVSEHAVENGSSTADHITERLRKVSITGMFSNHSVKGKKSGYVSEDGEVNDEGDEINIDGLSGVMNSSYERFKTLKEIARRKNPVQLYTALEDFELENISMVIESISYDRGPDDGESIKFTMKLKEIRRAKLQSVYVDGAWNPPDPPATDTPAQKKTSSKKKKGKKQAAEKVAQTLVQQGKNPKVFSPV